VSGRGDALVLELIPPARRLGRGSATLVVVLALAGGAGLGYAELGGLFGLDSGGALGALVGLALAAAVAVLAWPRLRPPERLEPVAMLRGRLLLPRSPYARGAVQLDPRDILHLGIAPGRRGFIEVLTARRRYRMPLARFAEPERLPELARAFHDALAHLEGGPEHRAALERSHALGNELSKRRPVLTFTLLGLLGAVFAVQVALGGFDADIFTRSQVALRLGANARALLEAQPWRILTAALLHGSFLHLYMNGIALLALGTVLERLMGPARTLAVFLWSAAVGGVLSGLAHEAGYAVGASGGIFGLLGALAAVHLAARERIPAGFRQPLQWWLLILGINLLLPVVVPIIDAWGHFGGALAGGGLGLVFVRAPGFRLGGSAGPWSRSLAAVAAAAYATGVGFAWVHAAQPAALHRRVLEQALLAPDPGAPLGGATRAVAVLGAEAAPPHLVSAAERRLAALALTEDAHPEVRLAWSEVLESRGALEAAAHQRWAALEAQGAGAFPALVDALAQLESRPLVIPPAKPSGVELRRLPGDDRIDLVFEPPVRSSAAVYLLHRGPEGRARGLLEVPVKAPEASRAGVRIDAEVLESLEAGGRLEVAMWAPALSDGPTLHALSPEALEGWRVLER
jgi:rhomboid protease GluP